MAQDSKNQETQVTSVTSAQKIPWMRKTIFRDRSMAKQVSVELWVSFLSSGSKRLTPDPDESGVSSPPVWDSLKGFERG